MSYTVNASCDAGCKKASEGCVDSIIVRGAVNAIHNVNLANGNAHQGYGSINLNCAGFVGIDLPTGHCDANVASEPNQCCEGSDPVKA